MDQLQRAGKDGSRRGMQAIFDQGSPPPCPAPFNLAAYVLHRAQQLATKTALAVIREDGAECWSYAALEAAVLGAASGFLSQGLKPGDRLLMRLGNSVEFPIAYLAAIAADIIPVPISAFLTEPEVARIGLPAAHRSRGRARASRRTGSPRFAGEGHA
jgi:hypothetical protein